jgi:SAM-dependent methyltransferase
VKALALRLLQRARLLGPAYRGWESVQALRDRATPPASDGLPVPPAQLRVRVAGTADVAWFLEGGLLGADSVRDALERHGTRIEELDALLDFGCGSGRVTRNWVHLGGPAVAGSDHDEAAVEWCRCNLAFARFEVNGLAPPLAFEDERFDLVYALSVFTHLTEELQLAWMEELRRVLRPAGFLLVTVHGESYRERLLPHERERFDAGRVVVRWEGVPGTNLCSAFHPPAYVRDVLARGFEFVELAPEGAKGNPHQDLVLLQKPG